MLNEPSELEISSEVKNEQDLMLLKGFWAKNIAQKKYV
jgi:hypothetical protein